MTNTKTRLDRLEKVNGPATRRILIFTQNPENPALWQYWDDTGERVERTKDQARELCGDNDYVIWIGMYGGEDEKPCNQA